MKTLIIALTIVIASPLWGDGRGAAQPNEPGSGNCLDFDGVDDYVEVPSSASLNFGTSDFTIEFWINSNSTGLLQDIIGKRPFCNGTTMWNIRLSSTGRVAFATYQNTPWWSGPGGAVGSFSSIYDGKWHHVTTIRKSDSLFIYLNGILDNATQTNGIANISNSVPLEISNNPCIGLDGTVFFNDYLDEVRIWDYARSQTQIREDMCKKLQGNESGLVGYWRLDEGSGSTAFDSSPNTNDGTLY